MKETVQNFQDIISGLHETHLIYIDFQDAYFIIVLDPEKLCVFPIFWELTKG